MRTLSWGSSVLFCPGLDLLLLLRGLLSLRGSCNGHPLQDLRALEIIGRPSHQSISQHRVIGGPCQAKAPFRLVAHPFRVGHAAHFPHACLRPFGQTADPKRENRANRGKLRRLHFTNERVVEFGRRSGDRSDRVRKMWRKPCADLISASRCRRGAARHLAPDVTGSLTYRVATRIPFNLHKTL